VGGITNEGKVKWSKQALVQARGKLPRKLVVPGQRESGYRGCLPSITIVLACSTTDFFSLLRGAIYLFLLAHGPSQQAKEKQLYTM